MNNDRIFSLRLSLLPSLFLAAFFLASSALAEDQKQVIFKNTSGVPVNLYWVNHDNEQQRLDRPAIANGGSHEETSYEGHRFVLINKDGETLGEYTVSSKAKQTFTVTKPKEFTFGKKVTLSGRIEQIKTYDDDGAVFPFFLYTNGSIIVKPAGDFEPENSNEVLNGMEVQIVGDDDSKLERYRGKKVTITGTISTGTDLHCFGFGMFVDSLKNIKER